MGVSRFDGWREIVVMPAIVCVRLTFLSDSVVWGPLNDSSTPLGEYVSRSASIRVRGLVSGLCASLGSGS